MNIVDDNNRLHIIPCKYLDLVIINEQISHNVFYHQINILDGALLKQRCISQVIGLYCPTVVQANLFGQSQICLKGVTLKTILIFHGQISNWVVDCGRRNFNCVKKERSRFTLI